MHVQGWVWEAGAIDIETVGAWWTNVKLPPLNTACSIPQPVVQEQSGPRQSGRAAIMRQHRQPSEAWHDRHVADDLRLMEEPSRGYLVLALRPRSLKLGQFCEGLVCPRAHQRGVTRRRSGLAVRHIFRALHKSRGPKLEIQAKLPHIAYCIVYRSWRPAANTITDDTHDPSRRVKHGS